LKPSDTHIERMAETFAERTPFLRKSKEEATDAWREALEIGREDGVLEEMEETMRRKKLLDLPAQDAWDRAKEY
jgi:hypothetical protein